MLGVVVAVAILIGLRSGARGGPLAIEPADARHVLLAPIDRALALRGPALRQLRFAAFVAVVVGAIGGQLAVRRLGDEPLLWVGCGALFALVTLGLAQGAALVAGGRRLPRSSPTSLAWPSWPGRWPTCSTTSTTRRPGWSAPSPCGRSSSSRWP